MTEPLPAYRGIDPYVFVSYSHADNDAVFTEIRWLQDQGFNIWYDTTGIGPGSEWNDEIARAIKGADSFLYFVTPRSVTSEHCRRELAFAQDENRRVVATHLEETAVPDGLRLSLGNRQAILKYHLSAQDYRSALAASLASDAYLTGPTTEPNDAVTKPKSKPRLLWLSSGLFTALLFIAFIWSKLPLESEVLDGNVEADIQPPLTAIAVLPFDDLSAAADQQWLSNGMTAELVESLGRINTLHVPARITSGALKQAQANLHEIGKQLKVGSIVTGSVRRSGDRINVVAQWSRIDDGRRLWSARYERKLDDIFTIQREIAVGIAEAIRTELGIDEATAQFMQANRYQTSDVRAWELLRSAFELFQTWVPDNYPEARKLALEAIALDPNYAAAHGVLAYYDLDNRTSRLEAAIRTLEFDAANAHAYMVLIEDALGTWDLRTAEQLLDQAIANNPNTEILFWAARINYTMEGKINEALAAAERTVALAPTWNPWFHWLLGTALIDVGRFEEAVSAIKRGLSLIPSQGGNPGLEALFSFDLALALHLAGYDAEALEATIRFIPEHESLVRNAWAAGGWERTNSEITTVVNEYVACPQFARARDREQMYQCLTKMMMASAGSWETRDDLRMRWGLAAMLKSSYEFNPYRQEPQFQRLVEQLDERIANAAGTYQIP